MKKRLLSVILALTMILPFTTLAPAAAAENVKSSVTNRIESFVETKISASNAKIAVSDVKTLHDFAGNEYKLVECNPTGYYIIHTQSGIVLESSVSSKSPYKGLNSDLYYGGPTYYYVRSGKNYVHTVLGSTISDTNAAAQDCSKINKEWVSQKDQKAADYLEGKTADLAAKNTLTSTDYTDYWVDNPSWFSDLTSGFGYVNGGYCGYIAANLILKYWDSRVQAHLPFILRQVNDVRLTNDLINISRSIGIDPNNGTWSQPIASVINKFCSQINWTQCASWHIGVFGMKDELYTYRRPIILFGDLKGAGNHAVVAYGYNEYENPGHPTFVCHYGWDEKNGNIYSNVHVYGGSSTLASNTQYNLNY